jgi:hypothetical protein
MPAYNPPPQVLFSPVTNYYQGKAIRLQQQMQQKELDSYDKKMELEERRVAAAEDQVNQRRLEFENAVGLQAAQKYAKDLYSRIYSIDEAVTSGELDEVGALEAAANSFFEYASTLPEEYAAPIREKLQDGLTIDEYRQIKAVNAGALDDYGLLDEDGKSYQQADFISPDGRAVQGSFDPETGAYIESDKSPIAPQASQSDLSTLTPSGINQATAEIRQQAVFAAANAASATEAVEISFRSPAALAKSGNIVKFGDELFSTVNNLVDLIGSPELPDSETVKQRQGSEADWDWDVTDKELSKLKLTGEDAARMKSVIYSLAFSAAVGEQGSRPSDKDIQAYIEIYGGTVTRGRAFRAVIDQALRRQRNLLRFAAAANPEADADAALAMFDTEYQKFQDALAGGSGGAQEGYTGPTATAADGSLLILSEDGTEWVKAPQ